MNRGCLGEVEPSQARSLCVVTCCGTSFFFSQQAPAVSVLTLSQLVTFKLPSRATVGSALVSASSGVGHPPWVRRLSLGRFAQRNPCHVGLSSAEGDTWSRRTLRSFQPQAFVEALLCQCSENQPFCACAAVRLLEERFLERTEGQTCAPLSADELC